MTNLIIANKIFNQSSCIRKICPIFPSAFSNRANACSRNWCSCLTEKYHVYRLMVDVNLCVSFLIYFEAFLDNLNFRTIDAVVFLMRS